MNYNEDKERAELMERFTNDLSKPFSERYYSEEELLEVFDTAGDMSNDYIQLEALMLGARLYPDSVALTERRAIFLLGFESDAFETFMGLHNEVETPIMELLRLRAFASVSGDEQVKTDMVTVITDFLNRHQLDSDELVIQFVHTVEELGLHQWLKDNYDAILAKVEYKPVFYYEVGSICTEADVDMGLRALEALTEAEPYSSEYWTMLTAAYLAANRNDDAATAIEYALAINPKDLPALEKKIEVVERTDPDKVIDVIEQIISIDPSNPDFDRRVIAYGVDHFTHERLFPIIAKIIPYCFDDFNSVALCLGCGYPDVETVINGYYDAVGPDNHEIWGSILLAAMDRGDINVVKAINGCFKRHGAEIDNAFVKLRLAFNFNDLDTALSLFQSPKYSEYLLQPRCFLRSNIILLMLYLRNAPEHAGECLDIIQSHIATTELLPAIEVYAARTFFADVRKRLNSKRPTNWMTYDITPFLS
ncbi:MAG: tetratricopeptide repeat protein [Muribaculaceae bacterium]